MVEGFFHQVRIQLERDEKSTNFTKKEISPTSSDSFRYAIDADKIESELGWKADENFESGILKTIEWYLDNKDQL